MTADGHVLEGIPLGVCHYLIVVGVAHSIQVKEVLHHFGEAFVQLEDVVRLQVCSNFVLTLLDDGAGLTR